MIPRLFHLYDVPIPQSNYLPPTVARRSLIQFFVQVPLNHAASNVALFFTRPATSLHHIAPGHRYNTHDNVMSAEMVDRRPIAIVTSIRENGIFILVDLFHS
jgi:hypothetical protein